MRHLRIPAVTIAALALLLSFAAAQTSPNAEAAFVVPHLTFSEFKLPNGMRVVLSVDRTLPVVTEAMIVHVGARDERPGQSGFAHLFEHLMFEGSKDAPKGVFDQIVEGHGGNDNADTNRDYTFYYENVPSNVLPDLMWLDADRLAYLDVTQTNMKNQIAVVEDEIGFRVTNAPYGRLFYDAMDETAFKNWYNSNPVIGLPQDLNAATLSEVRAFHAKYYSPHNVILVIVGNIDPVKTKAMVEHYFGWIPNHGTITRPNTSEPPQTKERVVTLYDPVAKQPAVAMSWHGPERNTQDFYAMTMLGQLLFDGHSSRLYQALVKDHQVATQVEGGLGFPDSDYTDYRAPGLFSGVVFEKPNATPTEIEDLVFQQIEQVEATGVSSGELERLKTKFSSEWLHSEQTTRQRAQLLALATLFDGKPDAVNTALPKFLDVTSEQMEQAARTYLTHARASVIIDQPGTAPKAPKAARSGASTPAGGAQ